MYDQHAPRSLTKIEEWFGGAISRPLLEDEHAKPIDATPLIKPSPTLTPFERIEIYNQQYWYRLLTVMQGTFPLLTRLFGFKDFNDSIAIPYLAENPPHSWSLNELGDTLPAYLETHYAEQDADIVHLAAKLDWAYNKSFVEGSRRPLREQLKGAPLDETLLDLPLKLQPHLFLVSGTRNLLPARQVFLKEEVDYWYEEPFPKIESGAFAWAIFRSRRNHILFEEVDQEEYNLLTWIDSGATIGEACAKLDATDTLVEEMLPYWVQGWLIRDWLYADTRDRDL